MRTTTQRTWRNWDGSTRCRPSRVASPRTEAEVVDVVASAAREGATVRAAGTGHSFNTSVATDGVLVDLTGLAAVDDLDVGARTVTVRAGTSLNRLNRALDRAGLALASMGTLGSQTVAGAISTGNHGTGLEHGPFADQVLSLRLVTADGTVRTIDRGSDPDAFACAQTSLGALGIVTSLTLRCTPRFRLQQRTGARTFDAFVDGFAEWADSGEHVSAGWLPWTDSLSVRSLDRCSVDAVRFGHLRQLATTVDEVQCGLVGLAEARIVGSARRLRRAVGDSTPDATPAEAGVPTASFRAFVFPQPVKFRALEYALPLEGVPDALVELRTALRGASTMSPYPLLVRVGAASDTILSPAHGRATGYVNLTVPRSPAFADLHRRFERVLLEHDGRPHWGKAHTATAEQLATRYPRWEDFQRIRTELDPHGIFTNAHVRRVLGPVGADVRTGGAP